MGAMLARCSAIEYWVHSIGNGQSPFVQSVSSLPFVFNVGTELVENMADTFQYQHKQVQQHTPGPN